LKITTDLEFCFVSVVRELLKKRQKVEFISALSGSSKAILVGELCSDYKNALLLFDNVKTVNDFYIELNLLEVKSQIITFTDFSAESVQEKISSISKSKNNIIISTHSVLDCPFPDKEKFQSATTQISVGTELDYDEFIEYLNLIGYSRDKFVELPGCYSVRGSIIDFWSYSEKHPVRIEFDGNFVESIRYFDEDSQRSFEKVNSVSLSSLIDTKDEKNFTSIFSYVDDCLVISSEYELAKYFQSSSFNHNSSIKLEPEINPELELEAELELELNIENIISAFPNSQWLVERELDEKSRVSLNLFPAPTIKSNFELLFKTITDYVDKDFKVILCTENDIQKERLRDLLIEFNNFYEELIYQSKLSIVTFPIKEGFVSNDDKLLLLSDYQIFNKPYRAFLPSQNKVKKTKQKSVSAIKKGDYVVHENFGIGKYVGLEKISFGEVTQEAMKIIYADNDVVYVNLNYLSLVKKYSSDENLTPTLTKLGSPEWLNKKARAKKKIKEAARELIELYAKRKAAKGFSFSPDSIWQKELEASFIYEDTPDQARATEEVKRDMENENPMDRLICGDVGFGKTEVAVRASFKAVQDGKQVAVLVPTTILAEQHYNTFKDRLSQFPVKVEVLSRFQSKKEQKEILTKLQTGQIDVIIGTHRLLSSDVTFFDLGLLIIDEEHRFGVTAKEKLKQLKVNVDTLTLTATPIPRTLNLSLLGARDLSIIATPPPNRQPIYTHVSVFDIKKIREWIMFEVSRGGQVFFVHDRIESIDKIAEYLKRHIPEIRIGVAHGKLSPTKLEDVIHKFLNKQYDLLLSTKIIESGIDIPLVNTIIVNRADRFGLAELHQLRGRVGRSNRQAYAYFLVPSTQGLTKKALKRLQAVEEHSEIGAGFNLSMRDLEIRGAGNLLGKEQSGFIEEIGFDLYIKLINEAVEELRLNEFKEVFKTLPKPVEKSDTKIETYFEIGIPEFYVPSQSDRLSFYTDLFSAESVEEINETKTELLDRFGSLPEEVNRLILAAMLKYYGSLAMFERIIIQKNLISIILPPGDKEDYYKNKFLNLMRLILDEYSNQIKFIQRKETMKLEIENKFNSPEEAIEFLITFAIKVVGSG
jgi:transcription-repair coupling factor (superfamily II helicase)